MPDLHESLRICERRSNINKVMLYKTTLYREPIINSFIMVEKCGPGGLYDSRLSNGPIESLNRKVKDLKRMSRSFRSFEHFRNRFLYATRSNPVLNGTADPVLVQYFENDPS